ncbi:uncharacterized protein LOC127839582 [Dreissena polymorpha]|uniref:uncharacterized protein LOC127839582 n=1 Tax=Dreissena polymorpha TaxID=45954 RepID=UPI0022656DFE|nr:uncharacterized protein LOC127839582 [Dreissena polymorpha]
MKATYLNYFWTAILVQATLHCCVQCNCCDDHSCYAYNYPNSICPYGCKDGYRGEECTLRCANDCQRCDRYSVRCSTCNNWYYLDSNGYCCYQGCLCNNFSFCYGCIQGYYKNGYFCSPCSNNCTSCIDWNRCVECNQGYFKQLYQYNSESYYFCYQCMNTCMTCTNSSTCDVCKTGFHGLQCQQRCSTNCKGGYCYKETGECTCFEVSGSKCDTCLEGYYGPDCSKLCSPGCKDGCDGKIGTCTCKPKHTGRLCDTCIDGWFGQNCEQACRQNCKSCTDGHTCVECIDGYHDNDCSQNCSGGCLDMLCRQNDAVCTRGCKPGYSSAYCCQPGMFGLSCESNCPSNCGTCTSLAECQSCKDGFHGSLCNQTCPAMCNSCTSPWICTACNNGYTGVTCQISCPKNCLKCSNDGKCETCKGGFSRPDTGCQCLDTLCTSPECISCANSTYYKEGSTCCPCNSKCKHNTCISSDHCIDGCKDGFFGVNCEFNCTQIDIMCSACSGNSLVSSFCKSCNYGYFAYTNRTCMTCSGLCVEGQCNSSNGLCEKGCKDGFWKPRCDHNCSEMCTACNQVSGDCLTCSLTSIFGAKCDMPCSKTCINTSCHNNGICTSGCISDFYGPSCEKSCPTDCARSGNGTRCSHATGLCLFGCNEGFIGEDCMTALELDNSEGTLQAAAIGGGVAAAVIVSLVVVVGLVIFFRRRSHAPKTETISEESNNASNSSAPVYALVTRREHPVSVYENTSSVKANNTAVQVQNPVHTKSRLDPVSPREGTSITTEDSLEIDEWDSIARSNAIIFEENGGVYYNNIEKVKALKIQVEELKRFVITKNMDYFKKEFEKLPYGLLKEYRVSQMKANIGKNRYKGIYPYDDSRVKVRGGDTDYINASFIDGYKKRNEYIATLGPMSKQLGNFATFWRMVWQHNVEKIVMVTNLVEEAASICYCIKDKCEKYWPSVGSTQMYGDIQVVCESEEEFAEFSRRKFTVTKESHTRTLTHLQFTSWPDKDVPEDVTSIIEFRQNVLRAPAKLEGPTIVHCSAGVGRTGTFIAIDILTNEGEAEGAIDVPGCVLNLRQKRPNMVQTVGQYAYLHHAVVHSLTFDSKPVASAKFQLYMDTTSKDKIRNMFYHLQETASFGSSDETEAVARNEKRTDKNREGADVPGDENRPKLYLNRKPGSTDYVNAVYVNSFQKNNNYILAQTPLTNTVVDFLALLVQANCACIVSLESANMNAVDIGVYLPADNNVLQNGIFSVRCSKPEANEYRNKRTLTVEHRANQPNEALSLTYLEFTDWNTEERIPNSPANFRRFIAEVDAVTANSSDRPVLIHCLDGASNCGLFCVVATLLQKIEVEHEVSVANAVRKVKTRRKGAIPNLEQFLFCHDCVLDYTQSFKIYSNCAAELSDC